MLIAMLFRSWHAHGAMAHWKVTDGTHTHAVF
jgi:hypothetical protein